MSFALLVAMTVLLALTAFAATFFYLRDQNLRNGPPPSKRGMFRFYDGIRFRYADPIDVILSLEDHPEFTFEMTPRMAARGEKKSQDDLIDATKKAFGVVEFTDPKQPGLTRSEMFDLMNTFLHWAYFQKKNSAFPPGFARSMDAMSSVFEKPITNATSDSGSIELEVLPSTP